MLNIAVFIICLAAAAFFAATEVAFFSLTPLSVTRGDRNRLEKLFLRKNDLIAMLLTGNSFAIVCGTLALDEFLPHEKGIEYKIVSFLVELILFFLLSEAIPKAIGRRKNIAFLQHFYGAIWFFYYLLLPMSYVFLKISRLIGKIGTHRAEDARLEVFSFISEHTSEGRVPLAESLATYSSTTIREIMTPMSEISSLPAGASLADCADIIERSSYSRYPVFEDMPGEITGYVDLGDLLRVPAGTRVRQVARPALFFPYSLKVDQLHAEMRRMAAPMVFVVNEYGLILGMVTEENLAEELVGDIFSHDQKLEAQYLSAVEAGAFEIDCAMDFDDFNKYFSLNIDKENFETVGGFLLNAFGRIPKKGEEIDLGSGVFVILEGNTRVINRVRFKPKKSR